MPHRADRELILARGRDARRLLSDPAFAIILGELKGLYATELFATAPEDQKRREILYHQHVAVQTIEELLKQRVFQAEQLEKDEDGNGGDPGYDDTD